MRYFGVININDKNAQTFIDGIRLLCSDNSKIKHQAHVTLIGPKKSEKEVRKRFKDISGNEQIIYVNGVGNFFSEGRNTVYLKCDLDLGKENENLSKENERYKKRHYNSWQIKEMMDKSDYGNDNPHITLYDGDDREFAERLYNLAQTRTYKDKIQFQIIVSGNKKESELRESNLDIIWSKKEYLPIDSTFYHHLSYYLNGTTINETTIERLSKAKRLEYIENLFSLFSNWQNSRVIANPSIDVINKLNLTEQNGLYFYDDIKEWSNFPTNIKQAIHQAKPFAFFSLQDVNEAKRFDTNLPFVFIYSNPTEKEEEIIRRKVFNFGRAPIVILHRKEIKIFNGLVYSRTSEEADNLLLSRKLSDFSYEKLLTQSFWDEHLTKKRNKNIYHSFLSNMEEIRDYLMSANLSSTVCNRLIGRLLFIRYFIDRGIKFEKKDRSCFFDSSKEKFANIIRDKNALYSFFKYFKEKYNGDSFPVSEEEINSVTDEHLNILSILFKGGKFRIIRNKELSIQDSLFDIYDFSIIPIELVSSVYEKFIGGKQASSIEIKSKKVENKAYYTPFFLADFVLENTLGKYIKTSKETDFTCPVLDPSCGSGIFLVEALRKIIEKKIEIKKETLTKDELWDCVLKNIFGIDIDEEAIDIAIFSIYVTILDYVSPAVISEDFKFKRLKDTNFFIADFFDTSNKFNKILSSKTDSGKIDFENNAFERIELKFIVGNPPWGQIKDGSSEERPKYITYCDNRAKDEAKTKKKGGNVNIGISDKQIAQAFLIRVNDFSVKNTEYAFVVTSKILYNANASIWRKYFLDNFSVNEIYDFSPVRTSLFKEAKAAWPTIVMFYSDKNKKDFEYFSVNSKELSKRFDSFSVTQQGIKRFTQNEIRQFNKHHDWFWKTMLYGSFFDFLIIKRLKEQYLTISDYIGKLGLLYGVGLKRVDGYRKPDATNLIGRKFIDTQKGELQQFTYNSSNPWHEKTAGNIPHKDLFTPPLALIKEGLTPDIKGVATFCNEKVVFTHSVRAIKGQKKDIDTLKSIVGLINSNLFSYYILHTGSSAGVDLTRANQIEQFSFPIPNPTLLKEISKVVDKISNISIDDLFSYDQDRTKLIENLNRKISDLYNLSRIERDFIDYTTKHVTKTLKYTDRKKISKAGELEEYRNVFSSYFEDHSLQFNISCCINKEFIGMFFEESKSRQTTFKVIQDSNIETILQLYGNLSIEQISKRVFLQKNIVETNTDRKAYCIIKANNADNWQSANAWIDLVGFIKELIYPNKGFYEIHEDLYNEQISQLSQ